MRSILSTALLFFFSIGYLSLAQTDMREMKKILIITSNQTTYGESAKKTSNHFGEIVLAYNVFIKAGYQVDIVSPKGGKIPIGYFDDSNFLLKEYRENVAFMQQFEQTLKPNDIDPSRYIAVYYSGGGAAMFGVPYDSSIKRISEEVYANNGIVSAVCHGTAGITQLKSKTGDFIVIRKRISGFPDAFEKINAPYFKTFPFSIEAEIKRNGGDFVFSKKGWDGFYVMDGRIITGQDPTASSLVAEHVVTKLKSINN